MAVVLTPIHHTRPFHLDEEWMVSIDHVLIRACDAAWEPQDDCVIYRADKVNQQHLMIPEAHFYGKSAIGVLVMHDHIHGTFGSMRVHQAKRHVDGARRLTLVLCQPSGKSLPCRSEEWYPSMPVHIPVTFSAWTQVSSPDTRVWLRRRVRDELYDVVDDDPDPRKDVGMVVLDKTIDEQGARAFVGPRLRQKIIATPLSRDVGRPVSGGPIPNDRAIPGTTGQRVVVTTRKRVKMGHDFVVAGKPMRIVQVEKSKFVADLLIPMVATGHIGS